jgi:tripartite-type tricarboxylate transporter receptor subunit TctC
VKAGKLRMIAVTGPSRAPRYPDVPIVADTLPGYEATSHVGLHVPGGTPPEVIERLNAAVLAAIAQPAVRERMISEGITPIGSRPQEYADYLKRETDKWAKVIKQNNIKVDQ